MPSPITGKMPISSCKYASLTQHLVQTDSEEKEWWFEQLAFFVKRVAKLPIVECSSGMLPAVSQNGMFADFMIPSLSVDSSESETTVERMWPLGEAAKRLSPPRKGLATIWTEIARGWYSLGVQISRISVKELAKRVRGDARAIASKLG